MGSREEEPIQDTRTCNERAKLTIQNEAGAVVPSIPIAMVVSNLAMSSAESPLRAATSYRAWTSLEPLLCPSRAKYASKAFWTDARPLWPRGAVHDGNMPTSRVVKSRSKSLCLWVFVG